MFQVYVSLQQISSVEQVVAMRTLNGGIGVCEGQSILLLSQPEVRY